MNTLREDTTATQEVVGALIFSVLLVASLSAGYVIIQDQVEAEYAPDATVEQSSIEAKSTDQLAIKPLVGDDVDLENAEVRVTFEDRNAPDAVLTDLQDAKDHSTQVQVSDTQTIETAGDVEPINQTVTYYERNGTTDQVELDVYKWQKEVDVEKQVRRYEVWNDSDDKKTVDSASGPPEKYDHSNEIGTVKRYEVTSGSASTTCYDVKKSNCDFSWFYDRYGYSGVDRSYDKKTVTETITVEYPKQPGDGWEKVSDEPVGTSTYELENPVPRYDEKQEEVTVGYRITNTTQEVDRTETVYVASENAPEADTDDDSVLATLAPVGVAEGGWADDTGSAWDDFYGDDTGESESSDTGDSTETNDTTETDESSGSDWFLDDDRYVDSGDSQEGGGDEKNTDENAATDPDADTGTNGTNGSDDAPDFGSADQALDTANSNAAFLAGDDVSPEQNSAIGMGGTVGSKAAGTWTQGESVVVQLDRPLLFEGERVTVQIVDSETNSLVMDRTVRIQDTKRFQFGPGGGATVVDGTAPDGNVSINDSVNVSDGTLGDLPNVSTEPDDDGDTPSDGTSVSSPDTGDSPVVSDPDVGSGDGDGESKPKVDIDCGWDTRTAQGGIACVGDQTAENDDSAAAGYATVCEDINCASGDGGAALHNADDNGNYHDACGHLGSGLNSAACSSSGSSGGGGGGSSSGGSSSGGGGSSGGGTVGGGSSGGGHSSGGNGDSGAIAPGI